MLEKNKSIYDIKVLNYRGKKNVINKVLDFKYVIIFIIVSLTFIFVLSRMIFKIEVVTNDHKMENKIVRFLKNKGIRKYYLKKNYKSIKKIKEQILKKYKDEIDWIEIESIGTKYIIRYEPRIASKIKTDNKYQNIVAKKDALIYKMNVKQGQILKIKNDYVKAGDVIVSGYIYLNEEIKDTKKAEGNILGETWYKYKVSYPLKYYSEQETKNSKNIMTIKFLNKEIELFNFNKYKNKKVKNTILIKNELLPISINFQKQKELKIEKENNSYEEALEKAIEYTLSNIKKKLKDKEYVKDYKVISFKNEKDRVDLEIFVSMIEDITEYVEIEKYENINNE